MESALTNTLSPGDRIVSFQIDQFSLLWIDQHQHLGFNVDAVESKWVQGANLYVLASKLPSARYHSMGQSFCIYCSIITLCGNTSRCIILCEWHCSTCAHELKTEKKIIYLKSSVSSKISR
jgi:hypothetical protein